MDYVKDMRWKPGMLLSETVDALGSVGFQSVEMRRATEAIVRMRKEGAKTFLTFTSNMVTSGLRGLFSQLIELGMVHAVVTTVGAVEEDIMKAHGERFIIGSFHSDDVASHEKGLNRVGNLFITNESYARFEDLMMPMLKALYARRKRYSTVEFLREVGLMLEDEKSILRQAALRNVPVFCPAITDGALGFHLYLFQQKHPDFMIDVIQDFKELLLFTSHDDKKALIALAVAHTVQCPYCIDAYTKACLEKGSNLAEMTEALHVATAIRGGASLMHGVQMRKIAERLSL